EVPHDVFYSYEEVLAPFNDNAKDPKTILSAFVRITAYLTDRDVVDYKLTMAPEDQQRLLQAFAVVPGTQSAAGAAVTTAETEEERLVRTADATLASFGEQERQTIQRVFGRLARLGREEEGSGVYPIRAALTDFSDQEQAVISGLARAGLLSVIADARTSSQTVGVADPRPPPRWTA